MKWLIRIVELLFLLALPAFALLMIGCGTERTEQQNTVEQEVWEIGPIDVETWAGNARIHKTGIVRRLSRYRTTTEQQQYTFPEARELGGAMLGGLMGPLAGGGVIGLISAFLMRRQRQRSEDEKAELDAERATLERQRDEVIAGIERAKDRLERIKDEKDRTAWDHLTNDLEKAQSRDTVDVVKARTS